MKNFFSKSFVSALMICSVVNTGVQAAQAPVNGGYETTTPFVMPTYQPQQPTQFGSNQNTAQSQDTGFAEREMDAGNAVKRGAYRLLYNILVASLGDIMQGYIHRDCQGHDELKHSEELLEWFVSGGLFKLFLDYPMITASQAERIIITLLPALIAAGIDPKLIPLVLGMYLPNLLASLKMEQRKLDDPSVKGWELKQSLVWWRMLYFIPCLLIGGGATLAAVASTP